MTGQSSQTRATPDEISTRLIARPKQQQECVDLPSLLAAFDFAPLLRNPYEFARRPAAATVAQTPTIDVAVDPSLQASNRSPSRSSGCASTTRSTTTAEYVCARCGSTDPRHEICARVLSEHGSPNGMTKGILRRPRPIRLPLSRMMGNPACYRCSENSQRKKYKCTREGTCAYLGAPSTPEQDHEDAADRWGYWPADQAVQRGRDQMAYRRARQAYLCVSLALVSTDRDVPHHRARTRPSPVLARLDALHAFLSAALGPTVENLDAYSYRLHGVLPYGTSPDGIAQGTTPERFTWYIPRTLRWHKDEEHRVLAYVSRWSSFVDGLTGRPADPRDYPIGTLIGGTLALACVVYDVGVIKPMIDAVAVRAYPPWFFYTAALLDP